MDYAQLHTTTHYTFLSGVSAPQELVYQAAALGYQALAITDECSLAGVVKAFVAAEQTGLKLIIGSRFRLSNGMHLIALAPSREAYAELSGFITLARRRSKKGEYQAHFEDLRFRLQHCLIIWLTAIGPGVIPPTAVIQELRRAFAKRLWIGINRQYHAGEEQAFDDWLALGRRLAVPLVACGEASMHLRARKPLQDVVTAIRHRLPLTELGTRRDSNAEAYLKPLSELARLYPAALLNETLVLADRCHFSLAELRYQYPRELVPQGLTPSQHLRRLVASGKLMRWPRGAPAEVDELLERELALIEELNYEYYFLTVHDIVAFARSQNILCQGRGSAANSVVCYCLFVTEIAPGQISVLFERFISKERDEPPDIDVDFEHQRREEVIQYIYQKYGRERAALAATVVTYHLKSAVRDVGKALGLDESLIQQISKSLAWWDQKRDLQRRIQANGVPIKAKLMRQFFILVDQLLGAPRHLSQHVGGFVICAGKISDLVPVENASMADRTVIQWDKEDLEAMHLLKVDVLALGMLSAIRRALELIHRYDPSIRDLSDIAREDPDTYEMLCRGESVGVFQVESRAQRAMLPRLQPRCFYDLVIEIAIVRPGPVQGQMVHPYLRRRRGDEPISYESPAIEAVLKSTLGVPIFQEQVMRLSMQAAGFSGGEADQLRRAITNWGKNSKLLLFEERFVQGFVKNGCSLDFAQRMFEQIKGFGGYGFPESHSASFALLCYASAWLKCHHPAAFYCALLNSQPMGFYSPYQLIQDARRQGLTVSAVDINHSHYDNTLERDRQHRWGIRLGFREIRGLNSEQAQAIERWRADTPFESLSDLQRRSTLTHADFNCLAAADALRPLAGDRHRARWQSAALLPPSQLLQHAEAHTAADDLLMPPPSPEQDVINDLASLGHTLRQHPLALLRCESPFDRCHRHADLKQMRSGAFVRVAGLVTAKQRPATASGVLFLTLEDETGDANILIWNSTQEVFRQALLTAKLLVIKGVVEIQTQKVAKPIVHIIAGHLQDYSARLRELTLKSRDFH